MSTRARLKVLKNTKKLLTEKEDQYGQLTLKLEEVRNMELVCEEPMEIN